MPIPLGEGPEGAGPVTNFRGGFYVGPDPEGRNSSTGPLANYQPGFGEQVLGGLLTGARRDFLLKPIIDRIAGTFPGVTPETLDQMENRLAGSRLSDVFEFVGEFGPTLALGFGAFGLGRAAAVRALSWAGKTATGARLLPATARIAARFAPKAAGGEVIAKPLLERGAEIAGGAIGLGGYSGAETYAETGNLDDAERAALTVAVTTAGFEVGLAGAMASPIARALGVRSRAIDPAKAEEAFAKGRAAVMDEQAKFTTRIGKLNERIEKANNRVTQELELTEAALQRSPKATPEMFRALRRAEERADKFYNEGLPKAEQKITQLEKSREALDDLLKVDPGGAIYTRNVPFDPKGIRLLYEKLALKMIHTPESLRGELGPSFARIYKQLDTAETMTTIARDFNQKTVLELREKARQALGFTRREIRKDPAVFLPAFDAWERLGEAGVRDYMARLGRPQRTEEMLAVFDEIKRAMERIYTPLVELGAEPMLTAEVLQGLGVKNYFPHLLADLPDEQIMAQLASKLGESKAAQMWDAYQREGLGKFSSIDWNRVRAGSLAEKIADKLPYESDPFTNVFKYLNRTHRRYEYGSRFGFRGELKEAMVKAVRAESGQGAATLASSVLDVPLGRTYYPHAMRQLSRMALGTQIAAKLTLAVIPNMSQPINLLTWGGLRYFGKGFLGAVRGEERDAVLAATALSESLVRGVGRGFGVDRVAPNVVDGRVVERLASAADQLGYWTLSRTGFSLVERWNRMWSGTGSLYMFRDTLMKAVAGKLRGNNLDIARRRFEAMGSNLDDLVRKARAGGDDFLQSVEIKNAEMMATFKGAQQTQFIPAVTRRPLWWNHPIGRVFTQFKSFALNQGRFIRDQVFAEAARGNLRPMAYFLSFYPVAGEVVGEMRAVARGKPREQEGLTRVISDYTMVGGIGLFSDTFLAAKYGRLAESIFGPTVGDSVQFAERMVQGDVQGVIGMATRQPVYQAVHTLTGLGVLSVEAMDDYLENFPSFNEEAGERTTTIDFGTARLREIQKKGQPQ